MDTAWMIGVRMVKVALHGNIALQVHAGHVFHDDVGGVVFFKEVLDPDDLGHIGEPGQGLGLPEEPGAAIIKQVPLAALQAGDLQGTHMVPGNKVVGVKFLNSHRGIQIQIPAQIGNAEAALAQDPAHQVLPPQHRSCGKLMGSILGVGAVAAVFTYRLVCQVHAAVAAQLFHCPHLSL